jgi:hypothetical protein
MEDAASRPRDVDDAEHLRSILREPGMMNDPDEEVGWEAGTWEGSRRLQLRRALKLTVRERLQALEALAETSDRLSEARRVNPSEPGVGRADGD